MNEKTSTGSLEITHNQVLTFLKNYQETAPKLLEQKNYPELMSYSINGSFTLDLYFQNNKEMLVSHPTGTFFTYVVGLVADFKVMKKLFMEEGMEEGYSERQITSSHRNIMGRLPPVILGLESLVDAKKEK